MVIEETNLVDLFNHLAQTYPPGRFTDKWMPWHTYCFFYEELFKHQRHSGINLLEIGIEEGGSFILWKRYFTNFRLVGLDTEDKLNDIYRNELTTDPRIKFYFGFDSTKPMSPASVDKRGGFDVIIDDGDHSVEAQTATFRNFWPLLKMGGTYVIEDIIGPQAYHLLDINVKNIADDAYLQTHKYENKQLLDRQDDLIMFMRK